MKPYFDAHPVVVLTNQSLEKTLDKIDLSGSLYKWAVELSDYDITFKSRGSIKAQALATFIAECMYQNMPNKDKLFFEVFTDRSSTTGGSEVGVAIISPTVYRFEYALKFLFFASNIEAEYEAVIAGLEYCLGYGTEHVRLKTDSQLCK